MEQDKQIVASLPILIAGRDINATSERWLSSFSSIINLTASIDREKYPTSSFDKLYVRTNFLLIDFSSKLSAFS